MSKTNALRGLLPPVVSTPRRLRGAAAIALLLVVAGFAPQLYRLGRFALGSELFSYILLVPWVSGYLAWRQRSSLPADPKPDFALGTLGLVAGGLALAASIFVESTNAFAPEDHLALTTTAFLLIATGVAACFLGRSFLRALLFPIGFLVFLIPIPSAAMVAIETFMQHGSAVVAHALFKIAGTAVFYQNLDFQLPGMNLRVAPECSGIRSTLVLGIVSVVAGYFFLRSPVKRILLVAFVLPLALLRNGVRIFTVGELCVHYGPQMIESYVHRHGGPLFFAASLIPFFLLVFLLQKREATTAL